MVAGHDCSIAEQIEIRMIRPSAFPVRHRPRCSPEHEELKSSIRELGLLQPIVVRPLGHLFEIVAGHRRHAACRALRWRSIPCRVRELSDRQAYEVQLAENLQRKSMDPVEEAEAYHRYVEEFGWGGASDLARRIGKSPEYVSHRMQLLKLSTEIKGHVASRRLGVSHAIEVASMEPGEREGAVDRIIGEGLTIRQVRRMREPAPEPASSSGSIVQRETLALRVALARIDGLVDDAHRAPPGERAGLVEFLMGQRRAVHSLIDDALRRKKSYA